MKIKSILRQLCPPALWSACASVRYRKFNIGSALHKRPHSQGLELYWDEKFAEMMETWGEGNVWNEIQLLLCNCRGRVLDIACGTGKTIKLLSRFPELELYGCDISDFLIQKAIDQGIPKEKLKVCDATRPHYKGDFFDYAYSIGSLEHFTDEGIQQAIFQCYRITKKASFHQVPVSRSGKDEGWMKTVQSFHNNSVDWWLSKFKLSYQYMCLTLSGKMRSLLANGLFV